MIKHAKSSVVCRIKIYLYLTEYYSVWGVSNSWKIATTSKFQSTFKLKNCREIPIRCFQAISKTRTSLQAWTPIKPGLYYLTTLNGYTIFGSFRFVLYFLNFEAVTTASADLPRDFITDFETKREKRA